MTDERAHELDEEYDALLHLAENRVFNAIDAVNRAMYPRCEPLKRKPFSMDDIDWEQIRKDMEP